jgi:hypothetical protein
VNFQIWIADGDQPLPQRLVLTYPKASGQPQFRAQFIGWNLAPEVPDSLFAFAPPAGANRIPFAAALAQSDPGRPRKRAARTRQPDRSRARAPRPAAKKPRRAGKPVASRPRRACSRVASRPRVTPWRLTTTSIGTRGRDSPSRRPEPPSPGPSQPCRPRLLPRHRPWSRRPRSRALPRRRPRRRPHRHARTERPRRLQALHIPSADPRGTHKRTAPMA